MSRFRESTDLRHTSFVSSVRRGTSNIVMQSGQTDGLGAIVNPDVTGTGAVLFGISSVLGVAEIDNPDVTGAGAVTMATGVVDGTGSAGTPTLLSWDFTTQSVGPGDLDDYPDLSFARASSGDSVQTGTNTVSTASPITSNDVPRFGKRLDADPVGLVFEMARTNLVVTDWRNADGYFANHVGLSTRPSGTAPDGDTTTPTRLEAAIGTTGHYGVNGENGGLMQTISAWQKAASSFSEMLGALDFGQTTTLGVYDSDTAWHRNRVSKTNIYYAFCNNGTGETYITGTGPAAARDGLVDFIQVESALYPTEACASTRAGERLTLDTGSDALADGALRMYVRLEAKGASDAYASDMRFWDVDADNHAEVVASTGAIKITVGGTAYTTPVAASWAEHDDVDFWLAAGGGAVATVVKYRVNGGSVTTLSTGSPPTQGTITVSGALDLLCDGTSNQFTARVRLIEFYDTGVSPEGF